MKSVLLTVMAGICAAGGASAQVLSSYQVTGQIPDSLINWNSTIDNTLSIPTFDANLGTLQQVDLKLTALIQQTRQGENLGTTGDSFSLAETTLISMFNHDSSVEIALPTTNYTYATASSAFDGKLDFAGNSGFTLERSVLLSGNTSDHNLGRFLAGNTVLFDVLSQTTSSATEPGNAVLSFQTSSSASLTVTYSYVAIPENSLFAVVLGMAVFSFVAIRRRSVVS